MTLSWKPHVVLAFALIGASAAASSMFLSVDPGMVELTVAPATSARGKLTVTNKSADAVMCTLSVRNEWAQHTQLPAPEPSTWLVLKPFHPFNLAPGSSRKIRYKVTPPAGFSGETMAMVLFTGPTQKSTGQPYGVRFTKGIPIYMKIRGTERLALKIESLVANRNNLGEAQFTFRLKNEGNVHVRPTGSMTITPEGEGAPFALATDYGTPVFPGGTDSIGARATGMTWKTGTYAARVEFFENGQSLCDSKFRFAIGADGAVMGPLANQGGSATP